MVAGVAQIDDGPKAGQRLWGACAMTRPLRRIHQIAGSGLVRHPARRKLMRREHRRAGALSWHKAPARRQSDIGRHRIGATRLAIDSGISA